jgi:hypothetical protein
MASPPYWAWYPGIILVFSLLPLYFPDGRLSSRRWRPGAWLAIVVGAVETAMAAVRPSDDETPGIPNPLGIESLRGGGALTDTKALLWLGLGALSAASLVVLLTSYALVDQFVLQERFSHVAVLVFFLVVFEGLWVAIAVAVLKCRLYDIGRIINRTLVYAALTATLALVYFGGVATTQTLFRALTGQEQQPQLAIFVSPLVLAALFNPLRRRIQSFIDRRFYRRKYDARKTLEAFSTKLRDETDLGKLGDDLVGVVGETMQPTHVGLWLREPGHGSDGSRGDRRVAANKPDRSGATGKNE